MSIPLQRGGIRILIAIAATLPGLELPLFAGERPWHVPVEGFVAPASGEHPRLLFRRGDLPALRARAGTPEGRAILKRLGILLDGGSGETMTTVFRPGKEVDKTWQEKHLTKPGVYTLGHAAGYGLLYQLTGEQKYADFGRLCFEKALEGVPDRDGRYGFRTPGGPLRAGPSLGWYAVGYDLCYGGWDEATREKFGRAIESYSEASSTPRERITSDLEVLAKGTRYIGPYFRRNRGTPPGSNHFGMQVGGASLALLAISGEKWVDQQRVDRLLAASEKSMIRNLTEGFGDGGFFAEGDGTGSMSSQIAFLPALQAWRNAAGRDFMNVARPNARMLSLKWLYQTIVREGQPDFWPVRGKYQQNVWSRQGLSGAGYFAIGFGAVREGDRSAMKWYYDRFLAAADVEAGHPCDTASWYPHLAVCAFVNWPTAAEAKNPVHVLPHCYRDSKWGYYLWRNRWKDDNDTVISVLLDRTEGFGGYLFSEPDKAIHLNSMDRHLQWGKAVTGSPRRWWISPGSRSSSLTMADGTCLAVDFTGASGSDVMLVTTGPAEGTTVNLRGTPLTFHFPTTSPPVLVVEGKRVLVGKQQISLEEGNLVLEVVD